MNIVDYKTQIDTLTSNLIKEYNKIEDLYIKSKNSSYTELNDINWCVEQNYNLISIDWYPILAKWLDNSYSVFKDH